MGRGQVQRIERAQLERLELARGIEHPVIDRHKRDRGERSASTRERELPISGGGTAPLDDQQRTGAELPAEELPPQRGALGLRQDKLDER